MFVMSLGVSCTTTSFLKYEKEEELRRNREFEEKVVIKPVVMEPAKPGLVSPQAAPQPELTKSEATLLTPDTAAAVGPKQNDKKKTPAPIKKTTKKGKLVDPVKTAEPIAVVKREPELEDASGFEGASRRPMRDPFRVGEKVIHSVRYFSAEAGRLTFETKPMKEVNGKKSYHFGIGLKTSSLFSKFYSVDDTVETFVDYENLVPHVFKMYARETGKLVQANSLFDHANLKATFWEKKYTEKNGEEIKNQTWDLLPYSQNAFSGLYYMRIFQWQIGKEYSFRVSDDEKNVIFKGIAEEKEVLETEAGTFNAIKIKALILSRGALTPTGNIYFWLSDDSRRLPLRIVAEIKIGKLVSEVIEIE